MKNDSPDSSPLEAVIAELVSRRQRGESFDVGDTITPDDWTVDELLAICSSDLLARPSEPGRVEEYLAAFPQFAADSERHIVDLIFHEICLREDSATPPTLPEYLHRFPNLSEQIRKLFSMASGLCLRPEIPGYEILEEIGRGANGIVYKAHQLGPDRLVAIKVLQDEKWADEDALRRFRKEAQVVGKLRHPNIVIVHDSGTVSETPYIVMEYVEGDSLTQLFNSKQLSIEQAVNLTIQLCAALTCAHDARVLHRDVKPANILVDGDFNVRLTDFGMVRDLDLASAKHSSHYIAGTPAYISPEQAEGDGHPIGPASDLYSVGAILYELLTGQRVVQGTTVSSVLCEVQERHAIPLTELNNAIPPELSSICLKCLEKAPKDRFASVSELAEALQGWQKKSTTVRASRRLLPVLFVLAAIVIAGAGWAVFFRSETPPTENKNGIEETATAAGQIERPRRLQSPFTEQQVRTARDAWTSFLGIPKQATNGLKMSMVVIPPGEFRMGTARGALGFQSDEPEHPVILTRPFLLAVSEVTQSQYEAVMGQNPSRFRSGDSRNRPVESLTWYDAVAFCNALSRREGLSPYYAMTDAEHKEMRVTGATVSILGGSGYRLPTEAEWEYACRAGTQATWYSGEDEQSLQDFGWLASQSLTSPQPVETKLPNAFGLYDMHGNVWEWVFDWYDKSYYPVSPTFDPNGPDEGQLRGFRGSSWDTRFRAINGTCANRGKDRPHTFDLDRGFRVARSIREKQ
ncbi:Serine/threonine-protein kinase PrkC [Rubinisphaera italica]|uniref:Serine/threonine-protein kinase PrkC n=2 Tax=Rubinisphaera italica TaxID=2527969 RepID=A0A5C5XHP9_9PLAN|nr:Serine/threonine-protein kinase PrkC [Rubinisphaera italica]